MSNRCGKLNSFIQFNLVSPLRETDLRTAEEDVVSQGIFLAMSAYLLFRTFLSIGAGAVIPMRIQH